MRLAVLAIAVLLFAAPCQAAVRVVATTADLGSLAEAIGGELVEVDTIMPAAADPEAFEPKPGDAEKIGRADLILRVGLGYDYWLDRLLQQTGNPRLMRGGDAYIDASAGIPLLEVRGEDVQNEGGHSHGVANPHYWLDPQNAIVISAGIAEGLIRVLPAERDRILANRESFLTALNKKLQFWIDRLAPFAGVKLIAYHNSWPYFARRFRLEIVDFIEPKPGVAPSIAHLGAIAREARTEGVQAILHEPYEPAETSRYLAERSGIAFIVLATSAGSVPGTKDYLALIDHDVTMLTHAFSQGSKSDFGAAFALLWAPFLASVAFVLIHSWFGIHILRRNVIFADLALSQLAALGATIAFAIGYPPLSAAGFAYAFLFTTLGALLLTFSRRVIAYLSQEAFIGVVYVMATAATVLVVDRAPQGAEHVKKILVGGLLTVSSGDLAKFIAIYGAIGALHFVMRRPLLALSESRLRAHRGISALLLDFFFFLSFGIVVTSSVGTAGVLLVFCFLIVPAVIGSLFSGNLGTVLLIAWVSGSAACAGGLAASYALDLPTGAAMVSAFGITLIVAGVVRALWFPDPENRRASRIKAAKAVAGSALAAILASSLWLISNPAADQPLMAALEYASGSSPADFLSESGRVAYESAIQDANRFRREFERLGEKERLARYGSQPLSDEEIRRISSYQRTFSEMARGEIFVLGVLREKARRRERWLLGVPLSALALLGLFLLFGRGRLVPFRPRDMPMKENHRSGDR